MRKKQPSGLVVPDFKVMNRGASADGDFGAPSHFSIDASKRTGGATFSAYMRNPDNEISRADRRKIATRAATPVSGARAARAVSIQGVEGDANGRRYLRVRHALELLHHRGVIDKAEVAAGLAYRDAYEATMMGGGVDLSEDRVDTMQSRGGAENGLDRTRRHSDMVRALPMRTRAVCRHVCCDGRALRDGYSRDGHEAKKHLKMLRAGLTALAKATSRGKI